MNKIGILGGTFNPPHYAHLKMARFSIEKAGLSEVIWIPTGNPPYKKPDVAAEDRYRMTELMICGERGMRASDIEVRCPGKSYTAKTLEKLQEEMPDTRFCLICGEDALIGMQHWYHADYIFKTVDILAFRRRGETSFERMLPVLTKAGANIIEVEEKLPMISSATMRQLIRKNMEIDDLEMWKLLSQVTKESVLEYIRKNNLYIN